MGHRTWLWCAIVTLAAAAARAGDYAIVVSKSTDRDAAWHAVVAALERKHGGTILAYEANPAELLAALRERRPRFTCFVARPEEATREFVSAVHRLARSLDDDPYTDTLWGILTGHDAASALRIAAHAAPLTVRSALAGTEIALEMCQAGVCYDELVKNKVIRKLAGGKPETIAGPDDTTKALVDALNAGNVDLVVTSGHATERDWQIGYRYKNGAFVSRAGQLTGRDTHGATFAIDSPNPKVYLPVGNCLMGHIDGPDAMALAWLNDAGVMQMAAYTVPTWFGYAGWGCLDYFIEQPGRYTLTQAFFANHHALVHRLATSEQDKRGLEFDRDAVAFYGDPAWEARMAPGDLTYEQRLTASGGAYTFDIKPLRGADSFKPINTNGSQRGWRPIVEFLPQRIAGVRLLEGAELAPVITDDFLLVPNPRTCEAGRTYRVRFEARAVGAPAGAPGAPHS